MHHGECQHKLKHPIGITSTNRASIAGKATIHKYIVAYFLAEREEKFMDKIKKYVERFFSTTKKKSGYGMSFNEMEHGMEEVLRATDANGAFEVITTFFNFGYVKGYRAAMTEIKKGGARA